MYMWAVANSTAAYAVKLLRLCSECMYILRFGQSSLSLQIERTSEALIDIKLIIEEAVDSVKCSGLI